MWRTVSVWIMSLVVGATLLTATAPVSAKPFTGHRTLTRLQTRLGLTDDQVKALQQIYEHHAEARRQLWGPLHEARTALRELALKGDDEAALQAKTAEVRQLLGQVVEMRVKTLQEISRVLTPEQRDKLTQMNFPEELRRMHRGR